MTHHTFKNNRHTNLNTTSPIVNVLPLIVAGLSTQLYVNLVPQTHDAPALRDDLEGGVRQR